MFSLFVEGLSLPVSEVKELISDFFRLIFRDSLCKPLTVVTLIFIPFHNAKKHVDQ